MWYRVAYAALYYIIRGVNMEYYGIIYKMVNEVNGKVYVGQTTRTLEERFRDHMKDARRKNRRIHLLQKDLLKYGKEKFEMKIICFCKDKDQLDDLEIYYTEKYRKKYGTKVYNRRTGSKGGYHCEETIKLVSGANKGKEAWNKGKTCPQLSGKKNGMYGQYGKQKTSKAVICMDLNGNKIKDFISVGAAAEWLRNNENEKASFSLIAAVCRGVRKTAYGYKWEYA